MPITLFDLKRKQRTVTVTYFGDSFDVVYNPGEITDEMFDDLTGEAGEARLGQLNEMLAHILISWEVEVAPTDSTPIPIHDAEGAPSPEMRSLPIPFKNAVLEAIMLDVRENPSTKQSAANSGGRSRRTG